MAIPSTYPQLEQKVYVVINPGKPSELKFQGRVRKIHEDGRLDVNLGKEVDLNLVRPHLPVMLDYPQNEVFYEFQTVIQELSGDRALGYVVTLSEQPKPVKVQRRNYYRLSCEIPVSFFEVDLPQGFEDDDEIQRRFYSSLAAQKESLFEKAEAFDLSGGGLGIEADIDCEPGALLYLEFEVEKKPFCAVAEVKISVEQADDVFHWGVEFVGLAESDREEIIQFIFKKQNEALQKQREAQDRQQDDD